MLFLYSGQLLFGFHLSWKRFCLFYNWAYSFPNLKTFLIRTFEPFLQVYHIAVLLAWCHRCLKTELALEFTPGIGSKYWILQFYLYLQIPTKCFWSVNFPCGWENFNQSGYSNDVMYIYHESINCPREMLLTLRAGAHSTTCVFTEDCICGHWIPWSLTFIFFPPAQEVQSYLSKTYTLNQCSFRQTKNAENYMWSLINAGLEIAFAVWTVLSSLS